MVLLPYTLLIPQLPYTGAGIKLENIKTLSRLSFTQFGHIWKDILPGMPPMISTARPEDAEMYSS